MVEPARERDGPAGDEVEVTRAMIEAGVDFCLEQGVENVAILDGFVRRLYQRMALYSRIQNPQK
jgi:hypothetical protein